MTELQLYRRRAEKLRLTILIPNSFTIASCPFGYLVACQRYLQFSYFAARWHLIGDCTKNLLVFLTSQIIFSMFQINFIRVWHANDSALYYLALDTTILVFVNNLGMLKKKSSYMPWIFFISLIIRFVIESSVCLWRWLDWRKDHPNEKLINISIKILENMGKLLVWII